MKLIFLTDVVMTPLDTKKRKQALLFKFFCFSSIQISYYSSEHKELTVLCRDASVLF